MKKICIIFASHHLLLYVVYMCQKSLNFTSAFKCYQQNVSGFTLAGPPGRKTKIGTEVGHITRDLDTAFKVKRSMVKVTRPLCSPLP